MENNCSSNDFLYAELYDKFLKLENDTINIIEILGKQTNIIDFMITTYNTNNKIQTKLNNDIIIIFIIILLIILCLFHHIKHK
jgi:hypothetical protein